MVEANCFDNLTSDVNTILFKRFILEKYRNWLQEHGEIYRSLINRRTWEIIKKQGATSSLDFGQMFPNIQKESREVHDELRKISKIIGYSHLQGRHNDG